MHHSVTIIYALLKLNFMMLHLLKQFKRIVSTIYLPKKRI